MNADKSQGGFSGQLLADAFPLPESLAASLFDEPLDLPGDGAAGAVETAHGDAPDGSGGGGDDSRRIVLVVEGAHYDALEALAEALNGLPWYVEANGRTSPQSLADNFLHWEARYLMARPDELARRIADDAEGTRARREECLARLENALQRARRVGKGARREK